MKVKVISRRKAKIILQMVDFFFLSSMKNCKIRIIFLLHDFSTLYVLFIEIKITCEHQAVLVLYSNLSNKQACLLIVFN